MTQTSFWDFSLHVAPKLHKADLVCFAYGLLGDLDFSHELLAKTHIFEDLAYLSKDFDCLAICGADTNLYGRKSRSALIAKSGKVLDSCDITHNYFDDFATSDYHFLYQNVGLVIDTDIYFARCAQKCVQDGAEILLFLQQKPLPLCLFKSACLQNGVCGILVAQGLCAICDHQGSIAFSSTQPHIILDFEPQCDKSILNFVK